MNLNKVCQHCVNLLVGHNIISNESHKSLLDALKDRRGYSHLKEEALDCTMWINRFGGGFQPVVRQNNE